MIQAEGRVCREIGRKKLSALLESAGDIWLSHRVGQTQPWGAEEGFKAAE